LGVAKQGSSFLAEMDEVVDAVFATIGQDEGKKRIKSNFRRAHTAHKLDAALGDFYDEFAIGWNELFDQEEPSVPPAPQGQQFNSIPQSSAAVWRAEAVKGKETPSYFRISGGKQGFIDREMKANLQYCPVKQIRKPAEVMEGELDRLRKRLNEEHQRSRKDARQLRRLGRRCRVKRGEDLDELEERYLSGGQLQSLAGADGCLPSARSHRPHTLDTTKEFFSKLGRRHPVGLPHTAR